MIIVKDRKENEILLNDAADVCSSSYTSRNATVPLTEPHTAIIGFPVGLFDAGRNLKYIK